MAIEKKRMRQRRGPYTDFDATKALAQELQVVTGGDPNTKDGKSVYVPIIAGDLRRLVTSDELADVTTDAIQQVESTIEPYLKNAQAAATYANAQAKYAAEQGQNAEAAANAANNVAQNLEDMRDNGAFKGDKGDTGGKGDKGDSGVTAPAAGMFAMEVDSSTGDLYAIYGDKVGDIDFDYAADTGQLWAVIGE